MKTITMSLKEHDEILNKAFETESMVSKNLVCDKSIAGSVQWYDLGEKLKLKEDRIKDLENELSYSFRCLDSKEGRLQSLTRLNDALNLGINYERERAGMLEETIKTLKRFSVIEFLKWRKDEKEKSRF